MEEKAEEALRIAKEIIRTEQILAELRNRFDELWKSLPEPVYIGVAAEGDSVF